MIRDIYKNNEYFLNYFVKKEKLFKSMELAMKQRKESDDFIGENDQGIINAYKALSINYMSYMIAQYSAGEDIEKIKESYTKLLYYSEKIWSENSSYVDILWIVAMGVLLDISNEDKQLLYRIIEKYNKNDRLIDFFKSYIFNDKLQSIDYIMQNPYKFLDKYVSNQSNDINIIKDYLENYWYDAHSDMAWYNTHKDDSNTYFGYWSLESAAIIKILNIDDNILKNVVYYPYDMVHYKK